jgi:hypothetical protein
MGNPAGGRDIPGDATEVVRVGDTQEPRNDGPRVTPDCTGRQKGPSTGVSEQGGGRGGVTLPAPLAPTFSVRLNVTAAP